MQQFRNSEQLVNHFQAMSCCKKCNNLIWGKVQLYIGGYQPAQKWLKDRKGRELGFEDILHYQKIIVALVETDRIMGEVDKVGVV